MNISLIWQHYGALGDFAARPLKKIPEIESPGLYMHLLPISGKFAVTYVGSTNHLLNRQYQQASAVKCGLGAIIHKPEEAQAHPYITYVPSYDSFPSQSQDIDYTLQETLVLCAPLDAIDYDLKGLEGAIQLHLWRYADTRKFLLTGVSTYRLRNCVIRNGFQVGHVLGLMDSRSTIITP